jgi:hypothetical protein
MGDLMVQRASAEGPTLHASFPVHRQVVGGVTHGGLQANAEVLRRLEALLG